jgi:hypothetical protein
MNKSAMKIPGAAIGGGGRYSCFVTEHPALRELRVDAGRLAGVEFDGTAKGLLALSRADREAVETHLRPLVEANREILESEPENHIRVSEIRKGQNLILDQGLNNVMTSYAWCQGFQACAVGTGTTPTYVDSGVITATASATTVTSSAGFFTSGMTGYLIKFDSGEERYITFVDTTHATLSSALTVGSPTQFTVWAVNQTGLDTETKRSNTYLAGAGNCGTAWTASTSAQMRTFDFSVEVANINYTELGWSNTTSSGANLFSRTLISGGTVSVLIGQGLRVVYTLTITVSSSTSAGEYDITDWPVAPSTVLTGDYSLANPFGNTNVSPIGQVGENGGSNVNSGCAYEIGANQWPGGNGCRLGTGSTMPVFGNEYSPGSSANCSSFSLGSYVSNSFERDYNFHFGVGDGNRSDYRGIYLQGASTLFVFIFDEPQTKDNLHTLDVSVTIQVGRVLTNP